MFFKKRDSRLVTHVSGTVRTQIDYIMVKSQHRKFVKDVKVVPGEEVVQQHQLLLCDILVGPMKNYRKILVPKRKVWRLQETSIRNPFVSHIRDKSSTIDKIWDVESMWKSLEADLLESVYTVCGWTKGPPRHRVTLRWNDIVAAVVKEKRAAWKCWQNGDSKNKYLLAKKAAKSCIRC